jgi:PD-(D/E)XK nuclease superfamily
MTYSYTQIGQYLTCPRRYRHRYLDGWKEKDTRAAVFFGRAFELALSAYFRREDPGEVLFREWSAYKTQDLLFSKQDNWDRMLSQGIMLLTRFCQDDRVRITQPMRNLQIKVARAIGRNQFVSYVDAIGKLDGIRCLLEWKTSSSRYPEQPEGLLALDPQLVCYSWMTGVSEVAQVVFVRKSLSEIQYLKTTITEKQREEFGVWLRTPFGESNQRNFYPTVESAFPRIPV